MEPILQVKDLSYVYSAGTPFEHKALDNVNFTLNRGEFVGIIGHTGSGKSTTLAAMMDYINDTMKRHIITIEDPIEFVHKNKNLSLIHI